jgi:protein-disulfide isomerase-like protein with CxxC motif
MSPRIRKATAVVTAAALMGGGGIGVAQAGTGTGAGGDRPAHRGGGPMSSATLAKIAAQLGVSTTQLKAAMTATKPAKPAAGTDRRAAMATELAGALGADVAKIQTILDANRPAKPAGAKPAGPPPAGARPSNTKLIAALASGLGIDEATVKAALDKIETAHKAEHTAREAAMYAALAKELGLSADAVQAAFEANRPAKPAKRAA